MKPQNHKGFKSWGVNRPKDICIYREIMTLHKLNSEEMITMWKELNKSNFSDCAKEFKDTSNTERKSSTEENSKKTDNTGLQQKTVKK